jgi:hypothetical protein
VAVICARAYHQIIMSPALGMFLAVRGPDGRWEAGLSDASPLGWLITLAYFGACGLSVWAGLKEREAFRIAREALVWQFWFILAGILFFLGINKQLDLQSLLTQIGRDAAQSGGWYESRRFVQGLFVLVIVAAGIWAGVLGYKRMHLVWRRYWLPLVGIVMVGTYVVVRMASFHHVDVLLKKPSEGGLGLNWLLEFGGNVVIAYAACRAATARVESKYQSFERRVSIR